MPRDYVKDPAEIYRQSFATIEAEARLDALPVSLRAVARRMIHACGMTDLVDDLSWGGDPVMAAHQALQAGATILTDAQMVASGIIRGRFPKNDILCVITEDEVAETAHRLGTTRSAAAVELWREHLQGAIVAIGNAPTALYHLLDLVEARGPRPAAIFAFPVGFVGAVESKQALIDANLGIPYLTLRGRRGGSAIAAAAINALADDKPGAEA
ncbi:precorrin-8X methylmutase [Dongia deserti]|uniref:precorrin-8X methylmutase n=1 Tax=Dongia deserti TaxID=2268030 RepID=UPI000E65A221|nr:precorrin-8X methylmutase [Dongia deserti]